MGEFRMPSLGADMEAGTLVEWLKAPGEPVQRGDIIAVVETQKGAIEIEVFETGILDQLLVTPGAKVPVGTPLALIRGKGGPPPPPQRLQPGGQPATAIPAPQRLVPEPPRSPRPAPSQTGVLRASPAARMLADEYGVDLSTLRGSGPAGAIVRADVAGAVAVARPAEKKAASAGIDFAEMRKAIAAAMARSKREIPHYYLATQIDLKTATAWLAERNAERPPADRLLMAALFMKADALALREVPDLNGHYIDGRFRPSEAVHVGAAVAIRGGGLVAPAIHDTDRLPLEDVMAALRDLVARVRKGWIRSSEMTDSTVTVTSLGDRGVESVFGVIYPPQVAIVGFGRVGVAPVAVGDAVAVHPVVTATLSADHRTSDGHRGAAFLEGVSRLLQAPDEL